MSRADYAHHNEEQDMIWWQEEGKHSVHYENYDPDEDDYEREAKEDEDESEDETEETQSDHSGVPSTP
jgi:hypothetical protein